MTLAELLQKLSYGPLVDLTIAGEGSGTVPAANIPKLVLKANDALAALYARFPLQKKTITLATVDGIFNYVLDPKYAQTSTADVPNKYIQDTSDDPFIGDILTVCEVATADGVTLALNDRGDEWSWFTPAFDTLRLSYPKTGDTYQITYRAKHLPLELNPADPAAVQIRLPEVLEPALLAHIAGFVYAGIGSDAALAKSKFHLNRFEAECQLHEDLDTFHNSQTTTHACVRDTGWV